MIVLEQKRSLTASRPLLALESAFHTEARTATIGHAVLWFSTDFIARGARPDSGELAGSLIARARVVLREPAEFLLEDFRCVGIWAAPRICRARPCAS